MSIQKINMRTVVLVLLMIVAAAMRLITYHLSLSYPYQFSNFTPFGAIALFGGVYFKEKWKAYFVVMFTLFLSDIPINYLNTSKLTFFNFNSVWVYLVFALMVFIGSLIKKVSIPSVGVASLVSVLIHWLVINLPWLYGTMYPHTFFGYGQSLVAAIPFERNMLEADIVFGSLLFGGFELAKRRYHILQVREIPT